MRPILFYTIGYPGAGKTTFARNLTNWFGGTHLRADKIGLSLFVVPTFSDAERKAVYQHMDHQAMLALNTNRFVLYDGALNSSDQRLKLKRLAAEHGAIAVGLWMNVPTNVARVRAGKLRDVGVGGVGGRIIPPELFERYKAAFEEPSAADELFLRVDGIKPFGYQYRQLAHDLKRYNISLPPMIEL